MIIRRPSNTNFLTKLARAVCSTNQINDAPKEKASARLIKLLLAAKVEPCRLVFRNLKLSSLSIISYSKEALSRNTSG
jgi:hypothetical protein